MLVKTMLLSQLLLRAAEDGRLDCVKLVVKEKRDIIVKGKGARNTVATFATKLKMWRT